MSSRGRTEDIYTLLYLVPFIASGVYGTYLWAKAGVSAFLPSSVYLSVTRDPYVFIVGSLAVMVGLAIHVTSGVEPDAQARIKSAASSLQTIAIASLVLAIIGALYANKFVHVSDAAADIIIGRYAIVFPTMMVFLSYLISIQATLSSLKNDKVIGMVALLVVPAVVYEVGRRQPSVGIGIGLVIAVVGIYFLLRSKKPEPPEKQ